MCERGALLHRFELKASGGIYASPTGGKMEYGSKGFQISRLPRIRRSSIWILPPWLVLAAIKVPVSGTSPSKVSMH